MSTREELIAFYHRCRVALELAKEDLAEAERALLHELGAESGCIDSDGVRVTVKPCTTTRTKVDETLLEVVGQDVARQITKVSIDNAKLDRLIDSGQIDADIAEQYITVTRGNPYIRMTTKGL